MASLGIPPKPSRTDRNLAPCPCETGPSVTSAKGALPRWSRRLLLGAAFWIAVLVMVVPSGALAGVPTIMTAPAHAAAHVSAPTTHVGPPVTRITPAAPSKSGGLPGSNPQGQKSFDDPGLVARTAANQSKFTAITSPSGIPVSMGGTTPGTFSSSPPPAAPHPSAGVYIPTGAFYGYIFDRETLKAIQGATVQAYGAAGQNCPPTTCVPVASSANGSFTAYGPVGFDYVSASSGFHLDNLTYATAGNGTRTGVGTIFLVQEAIVIGIVKSDTPPVDSPIAGVAVSDASPSAGIVANSAGTTLSNGSFRIGALDSPSLVSFVPPAGLYQSNFTWVNGTPGQIINVGTIYLERLAFAKINVTDAVTGGNLRAGQFGSVQFCSLANGCGATQQGLTVQTRNGPGGSTILSAYAQPGASFAIIEVTGYVLAEPTIGIIPKEASSHSFWVEPAGSGMNLTPTGAVAVSVGMSGNDKETGVGSVARTGLWTVTLCTMDGYNQIGTVMNPRTGLLNTTQSSCVGSGCTGINAQNFLVPAAPLRNFLVVAPDYRGSCVPGAPQWPIPGDIPAWSNQTWFNITPDEITNVGWVNLTIGTYVYGNVTVDGTTSPPSPFVVTLSSVNYPTLLPAYAYSSTFSPWVTWACGTQLSSREFCAPAYPGPNQVLVTALGYPNNFTWVSTPEAYVGTPVAVALGQTENLQDKTVNLTAGGFIIGNITQAGTNFGLPLASVDLCSVSPSYPVGCSSGASNLHGRFNFPAPLGWDYVKVSAAGYQPDYVWAFVNKSQDTVSVGNIGLQPLAILEGRVVDPQGNPVLSATAVACPLTATTSTCPALGAGRVGTDGLYLGAVIGGWLPVATYRVVVSAAGYSTNWAWVNATAGNTTNVSTLILYPSGVNGTSGGNGTGGTNGSGNATQVSTWLVGQFVDNVSGWGVETGSFAACPVDGSACTTMLGGTNTGGFFNMTIPAGLYFLNISATGYQFLSVYFNSSSAAFLDLGRIPLQPLPWLSGNVTMNPWHRIYVQVTPTVVDSFVMGPIAVLSVCTVNRVCAPNSGPSSSVDPTGRFLVWAEPGSNDLVKVSPASPGTSTSAPGGFVMNQTSANISLYATSATVNQTIYLDIFASVSFTVMNNVSWQPLGSQGTPMAVRYAAATITTLGPNTAGISQSANGGGNITFFLPPGNPIRRTFYQAQVSGAWENDVKILPVALHPGDSVVATNLSPLHFGWETGFIMESHTYRPAIYLGISDTSVPLGSTLSYGSRSLTNGAGFFNITAAASPSVQFIVGPGNDYNSTKFLDPVNFSNTSSVRSTSTATPGNVTIDHWGFLSTTQVNYTGFPVVTGAIDVVKNLPLWNVQLIVSNQGGSLGSSTNLPFSNDAGQFIVDAPPGYVWANYSRPLYEPNATHVRVTPSTVTSVSRVNMTGDGVVAALVISEPGGTPIAGANITDCLGGQRVCGTSQTNSTGVFWINATPGLNFINVTATGFISASPTLVNVCSDCFVHITPIPVYQPAYISGQVLGLPAGFPIRGANVSACSPNGGTPTLVCLYSVQSTRTGSFLLIIPAGQYILAVSDPNYNSTYLSLHVNPGQHVRVGSIFLQAFGGVTGAVYDNATIIPVGGAAVFACPVWSGGTCASGVTDIGGHYLLQAAPGPYVVTISAAGYSDLELHVAIVGGRTTVAPTAFLLRLGTDTKYVVSGTVVADGVGLPNALVAATFGGSVATSSVTNSLGQFSLNVIYGTYVLTVTALGEAPLSLPIVIHGPISGLRLTMAVQTYTASGRVTDGLTGQALSGVEIRESIGSVSSIVNTTFRDGRWAVSLPNGTTTLTAVYAGSSSVNYGQVSFNVAIDGAGATRNVTMYPPVTTVFGFVVDAASGAPLGGAGIVITGRATDDKVVHDAIQASASGAFQVQLPEGSYSVTGIYGGYSNTTLAVNPHGNSTNLVVGLQSVPASSSVHTASSPMAAWIGVAAALGVIVALAAAAAIVSLYRSGRIGHRRPPAQAPTKGGKA
jgi:hypothetical protein